MTTELEDVAVAAVAALCATRHVYPGMSDYLMARQWCDTRTISDQAGITVPVAVLRAAAKHGRIVERRLDRGSVFVTVDLAERLAAEAALTDGERAERTAAEICALFERNMAGGRDKVWSWPVDRQLAAVPQDGITPAVLGGLIREARVQGLGVRYVPADRYDVWADAYTAEQDRETAFKDRLAALAAKIDSTFPPTGRRNAATLTSEQLEAIVALIEQHTDPGAPHVQDSSTSTAAHAATDTPRSI